MTNYWLADSDSRILGPVSLEVVRDLAARGKLEKVKAVSKDGVEFVALREVPELEFVLTPQSTSQAHRAQGEAASQIREWLASMKSRPTAEVFRVPLEASRDAWRAAFFSIINRYVPSRLPSDATPELRLACEDAFLALAERMVDIERGIRGGSGLMPAPVIPVATAPKVPSPQAEVKWHGGMLHLTMNLNRGDISPFTLDPENTWKSDGLFVSSPERVMMNSPVETYLHFEGHASRVEGMGRVVGMKTTYPLGFSVKLTDLNEEARSFIRTWVQRG
jgi:hypothetical protein